MSNQGTKWTRASTPVSTTLHAVEAAGSDVFAVGSGGTILKGRADRWELLDQDGPADAGNDLYAAATTDDGKRIWFGGASGALGYYDQVADQVVDQSAPDGLTGSWKGLSVIGDSGEETIHAANGSGEVIHGTITDDCPDWTKTAHSPDGDGLGSGASVHAVDATSDTVYATNASGKMFEVQDGSWSEVGVAAADSTLHDVTIDDYVIAVSANGSLFQYDGSTWNEANIADGSLYGVTVRDNDLFVVGSSGRLRRYTEKGEVEVVDPVDTGLYDIAVATDTLVAVGESGIVITKSTSKRTIEKRQRTPEKTQTTKKQPKKQTEQKSETKPADQSDPKRLPADAATNGEQKQSDGDGTTHGDHDEDVTDASPELPAPLSEELPDAIELQWIRTPTDIVIVLDDLIDDVDMDESETIRVLVDDEERFPEAEAVRYLLAEDAEINVVDVLAEFVDRADIDVDIDGPIPELVDDEDVLYEAAVLYDLLGDVPFAAAIALREYLDDDDVGFYRLAILHAVFVDEPFEDIPIVLTVVDGDVDFEAVDVTDLIDVEIDYDDVDELLAIAQ